MKRVFRESTILMLPKILKAKEQIIKEKRHKRRKA
jgi:hypothetical protein